MISVETSRNCYVCKKLFCCAKCRERHEENKHTKRYPNCPFCMNQKFPLKSFEDKALVSHIVTRHLPLYCYLCGEIFKQIKDLESLGTCKWWKSKQRHSLVSAQKSILGTPPLVSDEKASQFGPLTSPPELYRNTSTPMLIDQKTGFNFKTPNVPNFILKTPKTDPASMNNYEVHGSSQRSSLKSDDSSNYVTCPSANIVEETPFRTWSPDYGSTELPRSLEIMKVKSNNDSNEHYTDNHCIEDMELTNVEDEMLPNSQSLETCQTEKRPDSLKKVRFSDQHETPSESNSMAASINMTENEEYFDTSEMKEHLEGSQIKIYEDNAKNIQKENHNPNTVNNDGQQSDDSSSRVLLMVIVENNSKKTTTDLINSGLKKLEGIVANKNLLVKSNSFPGSSNSVTTVDSYYSISSQNYHSSPNELSSSANKDPTTSNNSTYNNNNGGIFSMMANAMKNVMRSFSAIGTTNIEKRRALLREDNVLIPSTSGFSSTSNSESFSSQRAEKRPRDSIENVPSQRSTEQVELSPVPKRHRGWYRIKAREPIARMRQLSSQRRVSSETQVFHQGSLSVGNTILPLPDRAHQSTQTE